jgi:predicted DNA repair protein MutK
MASGIFAIFDDIAMLLDDAAVMSKVAAKKTAGLLGDDLAVNAEKATGFHASRELPVLWAITKGSLLNKLIILPITFLLSAFLPWLILPILLLGGAYLCFEGAEKIHEWLWPHAHAYPSAPPAAELSDDPQQILQQEAAKIRAAVRTDFILSIEIVVISLETVMGQSLAIQLLVVGFIALLATVGVYGLVALLVRMDDTGLYLLQRANSLQGLARRLLCSLGTGLVAALPWIIRLLGVVGTFAMLLVGGGIYVHNIPALHHLLQELPGLLGELAAGLVLGALVLLTIKGLQRLSVKKGS